MNEQQGITFTRGTLEKWAGRPLSDDGIVRLSVCVENSTVPDAIADICAALEE